MGYNEKSELRLHRDWLRGQGHQGGGQTGNGNSSQLPSAFETQTESHQRPALCPWTGSHVKAPGPGTLIPSMAGELTLLEHHHLLVATVCVPQAHEMLQLYLPSPRLQTLRLASRKRNQENAEC